ncbi:MAG: alpha/beta fold hydrolase [Phycisphaerales bacterium]|nr:alpha/beta fold hydrolase [Phycisphaerales bacterium]
MRRILLLLGLLLAAADAQGHGPVFTLVKQASVESLNKILDAQRAAFLPAGGRPADYQWPKAPRAKYGVDIYRVQYPSVVPEWHNQPTSASGLIAVPVMPGTHAMPVLCYQHGTVYGKYEVPSYAFSKTNPSGFSQYAGAYETRLIVAQYAGQGYVVEAADYIGMGDSSLPEAYTVKGAEQAACMDLYRAGKGFLVSKGIRQSKLFLAGWSAGGLVTTAFLEKLQLCRVKVAATFTASSPNDPFAAINAWFYHPREHEALWENSMLALTLFSYEHYYSKPGLAASVLKPVYYQAFRKIYDRDYHSEAELQSIFKSLTEHRAPLLAYLRKPFHDPAYFATSTYGKLLARSQTIRVLFQSPVRMYYGSDDEAIPTPLGKLAACYKRAMGSDAIRLVEVRGGTHRGTFITAVSQSLSWFRHMQ